MIKNLLIVIAALGLAACRPAAAGKTGDSARPVPVQERPPAPSPPPPDDAAWPEPAAPAAECAFERRGRCVPETPTRTALQPHPFHFCPRTLPAISQGSLYPVEAAFFSPADTRRARLRDPAACCYVEFVTSACD